MIEDLNESRIYIVGAGISGLIAAQNLENFGYKPIVLEASDRVGGRVKTDVVNGYQLDQGFQVLLEAYPMVSKYLNYKELGLQKLKSGAMIFDKGDAIRFGDPLRDPKFLFSTLFSSVGTFTDKWKIFQLSQHLKAKKLEDIFNEEELTTLEYLRRYGFSEKIISNFFKPFFSGIYLEPNLSTSSRMFEFIYKMFGNGMTSIPRAGIEAIPRSLKNQLKNTTFRFNTAVNEVIDGAILLKNGERLESDFTIVATDPSHLISNYSSSLDWKSCDTLYFTTLRNTIEEPIIGLNTNGEALVNNIFFPTNIATDTKGEESLVSATVVKDHRLSEAQLIQRVSQELNIYFNLSEVSFLKRYKIPFALPQLENLKNKADGRECIISERIAIAGDNRLNGSLNAAMSSGETAAKMAHQVTSDSLWVMA